MKSKYKIAVIATIIVMVLASGCAGISACVPVHVDAKYPGMSIQSGDPDGVVVIDGKAIGVYSRAYSKIQVNETNYVRFESNLVVGTVINSVCDDRGV